MNYLPCVLVFICLGIPCLLFGWFAYDCWKVGKELDEDKDL